jgi:hypothetical protein
VWILFAGPVPASVARRIGAHLLREAMTIRAELDLASYDRLGRVLRPLEGKQRIEVHDYVDAKVPVLARMLTKRLAAHATLGFDLRGVGARRR